MTEPEYTYVRGKGWIIQQLESLDFEDSQGKKWTLVTRKPVLGEHGSYSNNTNEFYTKDGKAYLEGWAKYFHIMTSAIDQEYLDMADYQERVRKWVCVWVTVIPR